MEDPIKKAELLVIKFYGHTISWLNAVNCSIIAVSEIISDTHMYIGNLNPKWKFWNDVLKELESIKIKLENNGN